MFITVATISAKGLMLGVQQGEIPREKPNSLSHLSICVLLATLQHVLAVACYNSPGKLSKFLCLSFLLF